MARIKRTDIYNYDIVPSAPDFLLGSDTDDGKNTKSYRLSDIFAFFQDSGFITEAPNDGIPYVRQNESWAPAPTSGSGGDVVSVFGRVGAVAAAVGDYSAFYSAIGHTHVEADITDLQNYALVGHTHVEADITDLQNYALVGHTHVEADITDLQNYALVGHTHVAANITNFASTLAGTTNTTVFTPTLDYHVATKKYVDDTTAAGGVVSSVFGRTGAVVAVVGDYSSFYSLLGHTHVESDITDLQAYLTSVNIDDINAGGTPGIGNYLRGDGEWATVPTNLTSLSDVTLTAPANQHALMFNGTFWDNRLLVEADISDLQDYVLKSGDTMTGDLFIDGGTVSTSLKVLREVTAVDYGSAITVDGSGRGTFIVTNDTAATNSSLRVVPAGEWSFIDGTNGTIATLSNLGYLDLDGDITARDGSFSRDDLAIAEVIGDSGVGVIFGSDTNHDVIVRRNNSSTAALTIGSSKATLGVALQVDGNEVEINGTSPRVQFLETGSGTDWNALVDGGNFDIRYNGVNDVGIRIVETNGFVRIGSGNPSQKLDVDGNIIAIGQINSSNGHLASSLTGQTHSALLGISTTANNYLVGGSQSGSTTLFDTYIRIRDVADGDLLFQEDGNSWKIWHAGNDGNGSGLDADLFQGLDRTEAGNRWGVVPVVETSGVMEIGKYIDFHNTDGSAGDNNGRITLNSANDWTASGDWNASGHIRSISGTDWTKLEYNGLFMNRSITYIQPDTTGYQLRIGGLSGVPWGDIEINTTTVLIEGGSSAVTTTLRSAGDVTLKLHADDDNSGENDNPNFIMSQDGDIVGCTYGLEGDANTAMTGTAANDTYWENFRNTENFVWGAAGAIDMTLDCGTAELTVVGDVTAVDFNLSSDERLKENIKPLEDYKITTDWVSYNWIEDGKSDIGLIAQDLEKTNPEFVKTKKNGFKTVNYTKVLVAKMAEKDKQIEDLQVRLDRMELILKELL